MTGRPGWEPWSFAELATPKGSGQGSSFKETPWNSLFRGMLKSLGKTFCASQVIRKTVVASGSMYCGCFQSKCCKHVALGGTSVMAGNVLSVCTVTITAVESSGSKQFL